MSLHAAELSRAIAQLLPTAIVAEVDNAAVPPRCRLDIAGRLSGWIPVPGQIGRNWTGWTPLRKGTQVQAVCPSGDPAQARIVAVLYTTAGDDPIPPPETGDDVDVMVFKDGTRLRYDSAAHRLDIAVMGDMAVTVTGTLSLEAGHIVQRVREMGSLHNDHAGKASTITHLGGNAFESESWVAGAVVTAKPDNGFSPPSVPGPTEGGA